MATSKILLNSNFYKFFIIPWNTDLDNIIIPGVYSCQTSNIATTLVNCPIQNAFALLVLQLNNTNYIQFLVVTASNVWIRLKSSTGWSQWQRLTREADINDTITNITRSGTTFTATRKDGTTFTFTQQDNNTWTAMKGATSSANGSVGYINATPPSATYNYSYWRADGTWSVPIMCNSASYTSETFRGAYGYITSSSTVLTITIPCNIHPQFTKINITKMLISLRPVGGGYIEGAGADVTSYITKASVLRVQGGIQIMVTKSAGWGITNNTPFCGEVQLTCTFS